MAAFFVIFWCGFYVLLAASVAGLMAYYLIRENFPGWQRLLFRAVSFLAAIVIVAVVRLVGSPNSFLSLFSLGSAILLGSIGAIAGLHSAARLEYKPPKNPMLS